MPKEKGMRKESPEIAEETENKKDDVKSDKEEEIADKRADLKSKIKENLKKAIEFQTEIKELTGKTLEGLEKMDELSKMLEELYHKAEERVESLEKDLEEKTSVPDGEKPGEEGVDFEQLLSKAKEIKELLRKPDTAEPEEFEEEREEKVEEEGAPEEPVGEVPAEEISPLEALDETIKMKGTEKLKRKGETVEKRGEGGEEADLSGFPKRRASDALEILEKYKKTELEEEVEVVYYENDDKKILDSECIVSAVCNRLEEAEKLYKKLAKTESPIDQFFVKQEIIRSQEALRGVILAGTRMLEKESSTLPKYTIGVMNIDVLKEILEKLSMQNWSKKTDFDLFNEYAAKLKKDFYARISVLVNSLKSLIDELGLEF